MTNEKVLFSVEDAINIVNIWVEDEASDSEYSESYSRSSDSEDETPGVTFVDNIDIQMVAVNNNTNNEENCGETENDECGEIPLELASITSKEKKGISQQKQPVDAWDLLEDDNDQVTHNFRFVQQKILVY